MAAQTQQVPFGVNPTQPSLPGGFAGPVTFQPNIPAGGGTLQLPFDVTQGAPRGSAPPPVISGQIPMQTQNYYAPNATPGSLYAEESIPHHFIMIQPQDAQAVMESVGFDWAEEGRAVHLGHMLFHRVPELTQTSHHEMRALDEQGEKISKKELVTHNPNDVNAFGARANVDGYARPSFYGPEAGTILSLSALNRWLLANSYLREPNNPAKYQTDENGDLIPRYNSPEELLTEWRFGGVLLNEVSPNTMWTVDKRSPTRSLNVIVFGRVNCFNVWGPNVFPGQGLYLIVKQCKVSSVKAKANLGKRRFEMASEFDNQYVWRLVPYRSSSTVSKKNGAIELPLSPPLNRLKYTVHERVTKRFNVKQPGNERRKVTRFGKAIYVGYAKEHGIDDVRSMVQYGKSVELEDENDEAYNRSQIDISIGI